jgi:adenylate cyclase
MEELMSRAIELNPNNLTVLNWVGQAKLQSGSVEEVAPILERAMRLSPGVQDNAWSQAMIGHAFLYQHQFEEALVWSRRAVEMRKTCAWGYSVLAVAYAHLGKITEARAALAEAQAVSFATIEQTLTEPCRRKENLDLWISGLRKAGMPERQGRALPESWAGL